MFLKRGERALRRMIAVCGFVSARERRPEKLRLLFRAVMGLVVMEFLDLILGDTKYTFSKFSFNDACYMSWGL